MNSALLHLRLPKDDLDVIDAYADNQVSRQLAATLILRRAVDAMRRADRPQRIGPAFAHEAPANLALNEPATPYKTRK